MIIHQWDLRGYKRKARKNIIRREEAEELAVDKAEWRVDHCTHQEAG